MKWKRKQPDAETIAKAWLKEGIAKHEKKAKRSPWVQEGLDRGKQIREGK